MAQRRRPNISASEGTARTKKGWQTKWMKHGHSKTNLATDHTNRDKMYAAAAGGTIITIKGARPALDQRRMLKYQHSWELPSGQKIKLKGFDSKALDKVKPGMRSMQGRLRENIRSSTDQIQLRSLHPKKRMQGVWAQYHMGVDDVFNASRERNLLANVVPKPVLKFMIRQQGHRKEPHTRIDPIHINNNPLAKFSRNIQKKRIETISRQKLPTADPAGLFTHEVAHGFDHMVGSDKGKHTNKMQAMILERNPAKPQKTKKSESPLFDALFPETPPQTLERQLLEARMKNLEPGTYQSTSGTEDFAESFRAELGHKITREDTERFHVNLTKDRKDYLNKNVLHPKPQAGRELSIIEKAGLHQHTDKFIMGGAVLVGGLSYGIYRYHTDPHFKREITRDLDAAVEKVRHPL